MVLHKNTQTIQAFYNSYLFRKDINYQRGILSFIGVHAALIGRKRQRFSITGKIYLNILISII